MKKFVCESLDSFLQLNEDMKLANDIFAKLDISTNDDEYVELFNFLKDNPNIAENPHYAEKFSEWVKEDGIDLKKIQALYKTQVDKKIEIDVDSFQTFREYKSKIENFKEIEKKTVSEPLAKETPSKEIYVSKSIPKDSKENKSEDTEKEKIRKFFTDERYAVEKLNLIESGNRGIYYTEEAYNDPFRGKKGQGLYIWTDLAQLWEYYLGDKKLDELCINFKFGQFGALAGKKDLINSVQSDDNMKSLESGKVAKETISGYSGIFMGSKVILFILNLDKEIEEKKFENSLEVEKGIQRELRAKHWSNPSLKSTEVFRKKDGDFKEFKDIIRNFVKGSTRVEFLAREEQKKAIDKATNYLKNSKVTDPLKNSEGEFLLAAKMRYGKNLTVLDVIKKLNEEFPNGPYKDNLVISYKPSVFSSLKSDILNFSDFKNFEIVEINKVKKEDISKSEKPDIIRIFISSSQYALYKADFDDNPQEKDIKHDLDKLAQESEEEQTKVLEDSAYQNYQKNIDKINKNSGINFGIIMADEYHYGTKSGKFRKLLENINYKNIIWVSGTAMKDMATGKFKEEQIFNWSYLDEQRIKRIEIKNQKQDPEGHYPHLDLPTMEIFRSKISSSIKNNPEWKRLYTQKEDFTFRKMIGVKDENVEDEDLTLSNENLMTSFLEQIMTSKYGSELSIFEGEGVDSNSLRHTFWVLPKYTKGIIATANLMKKMPEFREYEIIEATGQYNNNIDKVKNVIADAENSGRKSITLSCYRFKEGTTVPEWGSAIMIDDGQSAEEYLQAIFRCQSPGRKGKNGKILKKSCYVFDFQPARVTKIVHDISHWSSDDPAKGQEDLSRELLRFLPIWEKNENNALKRVSAEELIKEYQLTASFSESFANDRVFNFKNIDKLKDPYFIEKLKGISQEKKETRQKLSDNNMSPGKNFKQKDPNDPGDNPDEEEKDTTNIDNLKEKVRNILRTIPTFLFVSKKEEKNIQDIIDTKQRDLFEKITGVSPDFLKELVKRKILDEREIKDLIEFFRRTIIEFEKNPTMASAEEFIEKHMVLQADDESDSNELVNRVLDILPKSVWKNPDNKFCDPSCGTGKFLMGIRDRLKKFLPDNVKGKYSNEIEKEKYIIENMIYGIDNKEYKVIMAQKLLGNKSYKYNIREGNSLFKKTWFNNNKEMKFDVIVMNPPYNNGIAKNTDYGEWAGRAKNGAVAFIKLAADLIKDGGNIITVQPPNFLVEKNSEKTRNFLLQNFEIKEIIRLGYHDFEGVHQLVCISHLTKNKSPNNKIKITRSHFGKEYITYTYPLSGSANVIPLFIGDHGRKIFEKVQDYIKIHGHLELIQTDKNVKYNSVGKGYKYIEKLFGKDSQWAKKHHALPLNDTHKALFRYSTEQKSGIGIPKIFYWDYTRPSQRGIGVVMIDEEGEYGCAGRSAIKCNSKNLQNIAMFLESDLASFILYSIKRNMLNNEEMIDYLPSLPDKNIEEEEFYKKYIKLNSEEIQFLKEFMKEDYIN